MNIFQIKCECGGFILGPREGGKARGRWLGHDRCQKCRKAETASPPPHSPALSTMAKLEAGKAS